MQFHRRQPSRRRDAATMGRMRWSLALLVLLGCKAKSSEIVLQPSFGGYGDDYDDEEGGEYTVPDPSGGYGAAGAGSPDGGAGGMVLVGGAPGSVGGNATGGESDVGGSGSIGGNAGLGGAAAAGGSEPIGGSGSTGCCEEHVTGGCDVEEVEFCVCLDDQYCCQVEWDDICVELAVNDCEATCG